MLDKSPINILENIQIGDRLTKGGTKTEPQKPSNLDKEYWPVLILLPWHWPSKPQFPPMLVNMVHIKCNREGTFVPH